MGDCISGVARRTCTVVHYWGGGDLEVWAFLFHVSCYYVLHSAVPFDQTGTVQLHFVGHLL